MLALLCSACAATSPRPEPAPVPAQSKPVTVPAPVSAEEMVDHAGDSLETAISVPEDAPNGGFDFENNWIFDQYGRFRRQGGGTGSAAGRRYNVVKIELANGDLKTVYFDITENWNRWSPQQP
jgi:hypothetical protein